MSASTGLTSVFVLEWIGRAPGRRRRVKKSFNDLYASMGRSASLTSMRYVFAKRAMRGLLRLDLANAPVKRETVLRDDSSVSNLNNGVMDVKSFQNINGMPIFCHIRGDFSTFAEKRSRLLWFVNQ
jgi:hypothetical protein